MNLSLISHLSSIIKPHTLFGMIGDNLAKELKTKISSYEMVFDAAKDEVYFRINGEARKIPFRDSKTFADQAKKQMNKYVTEGATVNFIIVEHSEDRKHSPQIACNNIICCCQSNPDGSYNCSAPHLIKDKTRHIKVAGTTIFKIYSTTPEGIKELNTYQP